MFFGSCGSLDKSITGGHLIVPNAAYRDEGTSYHYAPASDYIEIKTAGKLAQIFDEIGVPFIQTKTWTTDGFYRETQNNAAKRKGAVVPLWKWNVHQLWLSGSSGISKFISFCMPPTALTVTAGIKGFSEACPMICEREL